MAGVEVVVVAFGAPGLLDDCLGALGGEFPVLVVDNSSDPSVEAVVEGHHARYLDPGRNLGFAAGVNVALTHRNHPDHDVLLLNPDAQIDPAGIGRLKQCLDGTPGLACVAPAQVDRSGGDPARVGWPFPSPAGAWVEAVGLGSLRRKVDFLIGSVLLVRSAALLDVGLFDERFFLYAEETDWQRRAHERGWGVKLCPEVTAIHKGAGTGGDITIREIYFHSSHERYIRKHYGSSGWRVYRGAALAGSLVRALVLPGGRGREAAARFHLYRQGPCRLESQL